MSKVFSKIPFARQGFTLIELLVATALLILLSTIVVASFRQANISSRDAKRKADLQMLRGALESYRLEHGIYPGSPGVEVNTVIVSALGLSSFVPNELLDPLSNETYFYTYTLRNLPGCPYELGATMESSNNSQACSACGTTSGENYYCVSQ